MATTLKGFLRERAWARVLAAVLVVALLPIWMVAFILVVLFIAPYESIKRWVESD